MTYWLVGSLLLAAGTLISILNISTPLWNKWKNNQKSFSLIPVIGGISLFLGALFLSDFVIHWYFWVLLFLDIGCAPLILAVLFDQAYKKTKTLLSK